MKRVEKEKERLSIDVRPEEHKLIKIYAARHGMSIRVYVLESIRQRLSQESEVKDLASMTGIVSPAFKELWDNDKDAAYDRL